MKPSQTPTVAPVSIWWQQHLEVLRATLRRFIKTPLSHSMTLLAIGIALSLPLSLYMATKSLSGIGEQWDNASRITLYLKRSLDDRAAQQFADQLRNDADVGELRYLSRRQALKDFKALSNLSELVDALEENPLPAVILLDPVASQQSPTELGLLRSRLAAMPEVAQAQIDMLWLQRVQAIVRTIETATLLISSLFAAGVVFIIGNSIRLEIAARKEEVQVLKLIGATNGFVRRPFLYAGVLYGFIGALIAMAIQGAAFGMLGGAVQELATLYESHFRLLAPDLLEWLAMIGAAMGLGWLGAWLSVRYHLRTIEPE